jgi:hypothetical protein
MSKGQGENYAKAALWIQQGISVNDLAPVIDLDPMAGIQSSSSVIANTAQITAGVLTKSEIVTVSPLSPNTLRILVLVEVSNRSFRLSFKVLLPEPLISIISIS